MWCITVLMRNVYAIIIGLVIVLVSVSLGFLVLRDFLVNNQQQPASENSEQAITKEFVCKLQKAAKNDGSVYTNELLGFSVKPLKDWKVSVECPENFLAEISVEAPDSGEVVSPGTIPPHYYRRKFEINIEKRNKTLTIQELEEYITQAPLFDPSSTIISAAKVDGENALKVEGLVASGITNLYLSYAQKIYSISHLEFVEASSVDNPKYTKEFDQLISSFKFLE